MTGKDQLLRCMVHELIACLWKMGGMRACASYGRREVAQYRKAHVAAIEMQSGEPRGETGVPYLWWSRYHELTAVPRLLMLSHPLATAFATSRMKPLSWRRRRRGAMRLKPASW